MTARLFSPSERLTASVNLINGLEESFLSKVVSRICQQLREKGTAKSAFNNDEIQKFQDVLSTSAENVSALIASLAFFLQQAAFQLAKPATLQADLQAIGLREEISSVVAESWSTHAKSIIEKLKTLTVSPNQVVDVQYSTHLQLASLSSSQQKTPIALLHMKLRNENEAEESFSLEMDQSELYQFYQVLENIQKQLDNIM